jgi:hypothetical protein
MLAFELVESAGRGTGIGQAGRETGQAPARTEASARKDAPAAGAYGCAGSITPFVRIDPQAHSGSRNSNHCGLRRDHLRPQRRSRKPVSNGSICGVAQRWRAKGASETLRQNLQSARYLTVVGYRARRSRVHTAAQGLWSIGCTHAGRTSDRLYERAKSRFIFRVSLRVECRSVPNIGGPGDSGRCPCHLPAGCHRARHSGGLRPTRRTNRAARTAGGYGDNVRHHSLDESERDPSFLRMTVGWEAASTIAVIQSGGRSRSRAFSPTVKAPGPRGPI